MHTTILGRNLRTSLLSGVSALSLGLTGLTFSTHDASAVVARDDQAAVVPVTYQCVLGPGGGATTTNVTAGALADGCAGLTYIGYTVTDLTPAPFNLPGFIGQCTGTLITPRMVLTAAHCYNEAPQSASGTGGTTASGQARQIPQHQPNTQDNQHEIQRVALFKWGPRERWLPSSMARPIPLCSAKLRLRRLSHSTPWQT